MAALSSSQTPNSWIISSNEYEYDESKIPFVIKGIIKNKCKARPHNIYRMDQRDFGIVFALIIG